MIPSLICIRNNQKRIYAIESTAAQLYKKPFRRFGGMASIKMQTIVIYIVIVVITKCINE